MPGFQRVALVQSHQRLTASHVYYLPDLVELCGLAAMVRDQVSDVAIPVSPADREPLVQFERFMRRHRPDLVGVSVFTCGARSSLEYARIARAFGAFVVFGGFHPSALPDEVLASPWVDAVVRGEGELTFAELVRGGTPEGVAGISFRDHGRVVHNPARPLISDLDALPRPLREIRPARFGLAGLEYHTDTVFTSRGCRGRCTFCANHLVGGTWRGRAPEAIVEELLSLPLPRKGPRKQVKFWDSSFLTDPQRVEALCSLIIEQGLGGRLRLIAEARVEDVVRAADVIPAMRRAGFARIGCGVESPNRDTHRLLNKGINLSHVQKAAELLTSNRIQFSKFLIVGHANESADDLLRYPDYTLDQGVYLQRTTFFIMTPYPGTVLAEQLESEGRITSRNWDMYNNFGAVIAPGKISPLSLQILHAAVAVRYGLVRRFLEGTSAVGALDRGLEPLLLLALMVPCHRQDGRRTTEECLLEALLLAQGVRERCKEGTRRGWLHRVRVRVFARDGRSVWIHIEERGGRQRLVVSADAAPGPGRFGGRTLHLPLQEFVRLVRGVDLRALVHDVNTLSLRPVAFRVVWLPALMRNLVILAAAVVRVMGWNLRLLFRRFPAGDVGPPAVRTESGGREAG